MFYERNGLFIFFPVISKVLDFRQKISISSSIPKRKLLSGPLESEIVLLTRILSTVPTFKKDMLRRIRKKHKVSLFLHQIYKPIRKLILRKFIRLFYKIYICSFAQFYGRSFLVKISTQNICSERSFEKIVKNYL